jgi:hypothetical protein
MRAVSCHRTISIALCALVAATAAACGDSDSAAAPAEDVPYTARLAEQACACETLACVDQIQQRFERVLGSQHPSPATERDNAAARARITECTATLARALLADTRALADALCACEDRQCYDALRPRVERVFDQDRNVAAIPPIILADIEREAARFTTCDERFAP